MENLQDNLNSNVDAEFISEEKTESIFGTTMARAAVVQSLFENEIQNKCAELFKNFIVISLN